MFSLPHHKLLIGLFTALAVFNAMQIVDTRTIFNELIPTDANCTSPGEHGCLCSRNLDCNVNKYLECTDGRCECDFPLRRKFDESLGKCVSLVGGMCSNQPGRYPECVRNSECEGGRCTCRGGYSTAKTNICKINFGEECGPNQCNSDRGLACKEGKCVCKDSSSVYSVVHANCLDPETVVRNIVQQITDRIIREIFNFKVRRAMDKVAASIRLVARMLLGPLGLLLG